MRRGRDGELDDGAGLAPVDDPDPAPVELDRELAERESETRATAAAASGRAPNTFEKSSGSAMFLAAVWPGGGAGGGITGVANNLEARKIFFHLHDGSLEALLIPLLHSSVQLGAPKRTLTYFPRAAFKIRIVVGWRTSSRRRTALGQSRARRNNQQTTSRGDTANEILK